MNRYTESILNAVKLHRAQVWLDVIQDLDKSVRALDEATAEASGKKLGIALLAGKKWLSLEKVKYYDLCVVTGDRKKVVVVLDNLAVPVGESGPSYPVLVPLNGQAMPLANGFQLEERFMLHAKTETGPLVAAVSDATKIELAK